MSGILVGLLPGVAVAAAVVLIGWVTTLPLAAQLFGIGESAEGLHGVLGVRLLAEMTLGHVALLAASFAVVIFATVAEQVIDSFNARLATAIGVSVEVIEEANSAVKVDEVYQRALDAKR